MKKTLSIFTMVALVLFFLAMLYRNNQIRKSQEFYDIVCGEGENQTSYISNKKEGDSFEIQGQMRDMKGCKVNEVKP